MTSARYSKRVTYNRKDGKMNKNWTVIVAVVLAIVTATAAFILRPVRKTGEWEPMTTAERRTAPLTTLKSTETAKTEVQSEDSTTEIKVYTEKKTRAQTTTETTEKKTNSKLVSAIEKEMSKAKERFKKETTTAAAQYTPQEFRRAGVIYYNGYKFTYYSEKVLPGKGLNIPGRYSDGNFVRDGDGYICVASCDLPKGTVVDTPFGAGKVYDVCGQSGVIDIYVSW